MTMMNADCLQLMWTSQLADGVAATEVSTIGRRALMRNRRAGVSGALLFDGTRFVELLEGEASIVRPLAARIAVDHRHVGFRRLHVAASRQRHCAGWAAGFADAQVIDEFLGKLGGPDAEPLPAFVFLLGRADVL